MFTRLRNEQADRREGGWTYTLNIQESAQDTALLLDQIYFTTGRQTPPVDEQMPLARVLKLAKVAHRLDVPSVVGRMEAILWARMDTWLTFEAPERALEVAVVAEECNLADILHECEVYMGDNVDDFLPFTARFSRLSSASVVRVLQATRDFMPDANGREDGSAAVVHHQGAPPRNASAGGFPPRKTCSPAIVTRGLALALVCIIPIAYSTCAEDA